MLRIPPSSIGVYPNSAEHFRSTQPDFSILDRLRVNPGHFFLTVGSMAKNKNTRLAIDAVQRLDSPGCPLVVVGGGNEQIFHGVETNAKAAVVVAGRLTDGEIAALYSRAVAFIFPGLYEGFGVPPLEAMIFGCPVIASTAGAVQETCGDAATYFNPTSAEELCERMRERLAAGPLSEIERDRQAARLSAYSWRTSASLLLQALTVEKRAKTGPRR